MPATIMYFIGVLDTYLCYIIFQVLFFFSVSNHDVPFLSDGSLELHFSPGVSASQLNLKSFSQIWANPFFFFLNNFIA